MTTGEFLTTRLSARQDWPFFAVLVLAALVRVWTTLEYSPLVHTDSSNYVDLAFSAEPVGFAVDRPSGYGLLVKILTLGASSLSTLLTAQHLAGLVGGVLVYMLLVHLGVPRWGAVAASALLLLDSFAVILNEHVVMAETFFSFLMVASVSAAILGDRRPWLLVLSGLLLGLAVTVRSMAAFAIPVLLIYVLWARRSWRLGAFALAGVVVPLIVYATAQGVSTGYFGLTQGSSWFVYGRVASLVTCDPATKPPGPEALCRVSGERGRRLGFHHLGHYIFLHKGPAVQAFGAPWKGNLEHRLYVNRLLRRWAVAVVLSNPLSYLQGVGKEFASYLIPERTVGSSSHVVSDPQEPLFGGLQALPRRNRNSISSIWQQNFPMYQRDAFVSRAMQVYQEWLQAPAWLFAALSLVVLILLPILRVAGIAPERAREIVLLSGSAFMMLLGSVTFSLYQDRYLYSVAPLLLCGATVGLTDISRAVSARARKGLLAR